jgi:hypothetical protein
MSHDDFAFDPIKGLPEVPPEGEDILWQGSPSPYALLRDALMLRWIVGYFAVLAVWRFAASLADMGPGTAALTAVPLIALGLLAVAILYGVAYVQARAAVYTITTHRVALRCGAALQVTFNIPYRCVGNINLDLRRDGTGTIAMQLSDETRISYLVAWPHVRPWRFTETEPALRCVPDAERVARILADAAEARLSQPVIARTRPAMAAVAAE